MPDLVTQKYVIIERARGYSSGLSKVYDITGYLNTRMILLGIGRGAITIIPDDDIAYNKTWTVLTQPSSGTAPNCVTDHNDSTACQWSIGSGATVDCLQLDLGSSMYGVVRGVWYSYGNTFYLKIYVSNDGSTWTQIYSATSASNVTEAFAYVAGYRYIKFSLYNASSATQTSALYTAEFYPDTTLPYSRTFLGVGKRVAAFVYNAYYQLLEVISIA